jgi:hypothetical protein
LGGVKDADDVDEQEDEADDEEPEFKWNLIVS